ncbi:ATPase, partial [Listeria monocytogenes]|nr:ATPase [Listeria monocytogenes]
MNEAIERRDDDMTIVSFEVEISAPI